MHCPSSPPPPARAAWLTGTALLAALASAALLVLAGCASPAGIAPQSRELDPASLGLRGESPPSPPASIDHDWWRGFGDPALDGLMARALEGSPTLDAAVARLGRAHAGVEGADAATGLQASASGEAMRQRYTANGMVPKPLAGSTASSGTLQLTLSHEFDFFGRQRSQLEAAVGLRQAAEADVAATRLLLAHQVTQAYMQLARLVAQRDVNVRALAQREEMLALIRQRVRAGLDTQVELRQGEGSIPETRQQVEAVDEQIARVRHALAALTRQAPGDLDALSPRLSGLKPLVLPGTLPADLLARRADVTAARWRAQAAIDDSDAVRAAFYPNVNLQAFVGLSSIGLDRLLEGGSRQYGAGAALHLPLFDQARLRASLRGKSADVDAAVAAYNGAVLDAVRDVADQLSSLRSIERQQQLQGEAGAAAEAAYDLATQRYRAGLGSHLTVLQAESSLLAQRRSAADLKARVLDTQAALARSVGGGFTAP